MTNPGKGETVAPRPTFVIVGASGFVGRAMISTSAQRMIKAITRTLPVGINRDSDNIAWIQDDLVDAAALARHISPNDVVINLAYSGTGGREANFALAECLVRACREKRVSRLVHCSTAVVVGATDQQRVTAETICRPKTEYETIKLAVELQVCAAAAGVFDVGILRPTAVVGPEGKNLSKLARSLSHGSWALNYMRASLFGLRHMHLVPVGAVVEALWLLAVHPAPLDSQVHIISSDDDPKNNFLEVEAMLARAMGIPLRRIPRLPLSGIGLAIALRLMGKTEDSRRHYEASELLKEALTKAENLESAVQRYGRWWAENHSSLADA